MAPTVQQSLRAQRWWRSLATTTAVTTVLVLAWTLPAAAQTPPKTARIGMLLYSNPEADPTVATLRQGLRGLGYREGQNLIIDYRAAEGRPERLPALAGERIEDKGDAGDVPSRPRDAGRESGLHRIVAHPRDDRDARGGPLGRGGHVPADRHQ